MVEGRLVATSHILGWRHVDVSGVMGGATGLPTITLNDLTALAAGEHWFGEGRRVDDLAVVTIGRGLGCGLVLGGRVHRGATGSAGSWAIFRSSRTVRSAVVVTAGALRRSFPTGAS